MDDMLFREARQKKCLPAENLALLPP
jgi:hypothetical protein